MMCKECEDCQMAKVSTHARSELSRRAPPGRRFASINLDLVGPLPESEGHKYIMTVIDRFSRWSEAIPLIDMTAKS